MDTSVPEKTAPTAATAAVEKPNPMGATNSSITDGAYILVFYAPHPWCHAYMSVLLTVFSNLGALYDQPPAPMPNPYAQHNPYGARMQQQYQQQYGKLRLYMCVR